MRENTYLGKPCAKGHTGDEPARRYRPSGECVLCARERARRKGGHSPRNPAWTPEHKREWERKYYRRSEEARLHRIEQSFDYHLRSKYGIDTAEYEALKATQGYRCLICGVRETDAPKGVLCVDHDHETGVIRGLLCERCNHGLGHFRDDIVRLEKAIEYLRNTTNG